MERLPTDVVELQALLKKLRYKELSLLADMAVKEEPDLERDIVTLISTEVKFKESDKSLRTLARPSETEEDKRIQTQIQFWEARRDLAKKRGLNVLSHELELQKLRDSLSGAQLRANYGRHVADRNECLRKLQDLYRKVKRKFSAAGVDVDALLPSIQVTLTQGEM